MADLFAVGSGQKIVQLKILWNPGPKVKIYLWYACRQIEYKVDH
jgi:hypothetical protein